VKEECTTPLRTRLRWSRNQIRRRGVNKVLIVDNKTYCLNCLEETDGLMYCGEACRKKFTHHKPSKGDRLPLAKADGTMHISAGRVRKEDGLKDYKRTPHVHKFYPPAFRCVCGKQQGQPAAIRARVVFVPAAQQAGD
jgi:hypothetical protein